MSETSHLNGGGTPVFSSVFLFLIIKYVKKRTEKRSLAFVN